MEYTGRFLLASLTMEIAEVGGARGEGGKRGVILAKAAMSRALLTLCLILSSLELVRLEAWRGGVRFLRGRRVE